MNKILIITCFLFLAFTGTNKAQGLLPSYLDAINDFTTSLSIAESEQCLFPLDAPHQLKWSRLPGKREGIKLTALSEKQKIAFHRLLRAFFPSQGYLKVTSIMFNEDIQQKNEPVLGRNEYWFSLFGSPSPNQKWAWKLEGHHLSINMSLEGNKLIGFTPITMATNPAVAHSDGDRDGLVILHEEEELARILINSFTERQLGEGYSDRKMEKAVYGELNEDLAAIPDEGILYSKLNAEQQFILRKLVQEYIQNFQAEVVPTLDEILNEKARFFFIGSKVHGTGHYYRIDNGSQFIEYENYDNHIHWLWRNDQDYGK